MLPRKMRAEFNQDCIVLYSQSRVMRQHVPSIFRCRRTSSTAYRHLGGCGHVHM